MEMQTWCREPGTKPEPGLKTRAGTGSQSYGQNQVVRGKPSVRGWQRVVTERGIKEGESENEGPRNGGRIIMIIGSGGIKEVTYKLTKPKFSKGDGQVP